MKQHTNRKSSRLTSPSKTTLSSPTQFSVTVDKSKRGEKILEEKCNELKEIADKIHRANELKTKENLIKDEEIEKLNDEIEKVMLNNYDLEMAISKELELRGKYEAEQKRIALYCNDLKNKFKNMQKTIKEYEDSIKSMKEENDKLNEEYEKKINSIEVENKKILKRIDDRIDLFNQQKRLIAENEEKVKMLTQELEQQRSMFQERASINKIKYQELEKQYGALQKKVYELQMNCELRKVEEGKKNQQKSSPGYIDIDEQIRQYDETNEKLVQQIKDLTKQWREMSRASASTEELTANMIKPIQKFGGKSKTYRTRSVK